MTRMGLVFCGAIVVAVSLQPKDAKSVCDDRQCRVSAQNESTAETATQSGTSARAKRSARRARLASNRAHASRQSARLSRREEEGRSATGPRRAQPLSTVVRTSATARQRFRAFIEPAPLAETQHETWRRPQMQPADLTTPPSTFAARIAPYSERRSASEIPPASEDAANSAHGASDAATARRVAPPQAAASAAPSEARSTEAPPESSFLRGLALALGGAATLASVLRLLIGA